MNFLDGLIILALIIGALRGRRKGLAAIIGKFFSFLAAIIMANVLYRPVAGFLDNGFGLIHITYTFLNKRLSFAQGVGSMQIRDVPFGGLVQSAKGIVYFLAQFVVNAFAFMLVFFFFLWIFKWLFKAKKKKKFTILGSFNRLGGFVVGGASSFLKIAIVIVLLSPMTTFSFFGNNSGFLATLGKQITGSIIANNIINMVTKIIS